MPIAYQIWLTLATWVLPDITLIKVKTCGVWEPGNTCDTRSFFIAFAAAIGQPVLALLALGQNRLCAVIGAAQFFIMIAIMYFHQSITPSSLYRDAAYYIIFHVIILIIDAFLERRDRQMFELREQLKTQFKATQRAQLAEKRAADLKKRFASYSKSSLAPHRQCLRFVAEIFSLSRSSSSLKHRIIGGTESRR